MEFRNYLHHKFNLYNDFDHSSYNSYLGLLKGIGASEIEHAGRNLASKSQKARMRFSVDAIHSNGMKAILHTGAFGSEDLNVHPEYARYAQRDSVGNVLGYGSKKRSAMMCPASGYVDDVLIPQLTDTLGSADFDGVFFDIPWIMKKGCFCSNCHNMRDSENGHSPIIRQGLEKIVDSVKQLNPGLNLSVNAGAPGLHSENKGASISDLKSLFDGYVTEWNPYRWRQKPDVIGKCLDTAKKHSGGSEKLYHATTCTTRHGEVYPHNLLSDLFYQIISKRATPRLALGFDADNLHKIAKAIASAEDRLKF